MCVADVDIRSHCAGPLRCQNHYLAVHVHVAQHVRMHSMCCDAPWVHARCCDVTTARLKQNANTRCLSIPKSLSAILLLMVRL